MKELYSSLSEGLGKYIQSWLLPSVIATGFFSAALLPWVEEKAPWLKRLGIPPTTATARRRWLHEVRTVAAYRDRYKVEGRALGAPQNEAQKLDAARAEQAIRRARAIAEDAANAQDGRSRALEARGRAIG